MNRLLAAGLAATLLLTGPAVLSKAWAQDAGLSMPPSDLLPRPGLSSADDTGGGARPDIAAPPTVSSQGDVEAATGRPEFFMPSAGSSIGTDSDAMNGNAAMSDMPVTPAPAAPYNPSLSGTGTGSVATMSVPRVPMQPTMPEPMDDEASMAPPPSQPVPDACNGSRSCLRDTDEKLQRQLDDSRLAAIKTVRANGDWSDNNMKARAMIGHDMSDDARRQLACDKERGAADKAGKDGQAAWYACDAAGLQAGLSGTAQAVAENSTPPAPSAAPLQDVTAEAAQ